MNIDGTVSVRGDDHVAIITIERAARRNALTPSLLGALRERIRARGQACGAMLLAGDGPAFCSGFDLTLCRESPGGEVMRTLLTGLAEVIEAIRASPAPVVVAAHRAAVAGGCAIAAAADVVVSDAQAKLGYPVVRLGVSPAVSGPVLGVRTGFGYTRERMLDSGVINGTEAARIGLVDYLVATPEEVLPYAITLAKVLATKPRGAMCRTKAWLLELDGTGALSAPALGASLALTGGIEEQNLLPAAWAERKDPPRTGR